jgi:hypothetical protein
MANIEKHPKQAMGQIDQADFSAVPTCARASHPIGQYAENGQNNAGRHQPTREDRAASFILRFEDLPGKSGQRRANARPSQTTEPAAGGVGCTIPISVGIRRNSHAERRSTLSRP